MKLIKDLLEGMGPGRAQAALTGLFKAPSYRDVAAGAAAAANPLATTILDNLKSYIGGIGIANKGNTGSSNAAVEYKTALLAGILSPELAKDRKLAEVAELLGYKSAGPLQRALVRRELIVGTTGGALTLSPMRTRNASTTSGFAAPGRRRRRAIASTGLVVCTRCRRDHTPNTSWRAPRRSCTLSTARRKRRWG